MPGKFENRQGRFGVKVGLFGAALVASLASQARAELVYEENVSADAGTQGQMQADPRIDDRGSMRQAIQASEKAQTTVQSPHYQQAPATQYAQPVAPAPAYQPVAPVQAAQPIPVGAPAEVENVSKAELMRRERVRQEVKNEDILQERLEQLRLRDEQRRTTDLMSTTPALGQEGASAMAPAAAQAPVAAQPAPVQTIQPAPQVVTVPMTQETVNNPNSRSYAADEISSSQASASVDSDYPGESEKTRISVQPRGGLTSMNVDSNYDVNARYSLGLGIGAEISDNVGFEAGYTYSEFGIALSSQNPLAQNPNIYGLPQRSNFENYAFKQNIFDVGLKLYLLGPQSKFRPFVGGGGAYSKGYVNYDEKILKYQRARGIGGREDYEISSYLGFVSTGFDIKLNKNVAIGGLFKYYGVLSSRESSRLNDEALYYGQQYPVQGYPYYNQGYYAAGPNAEKEALGGSLAQSGFYSVLLGATFTF